MNLRGPKGRLARRLGISLSPKTARVLERRPNPPGQHGAARVNKASEYKRQLTEKQRLRAQYNVSESQLRLTFARANRLGGNTGERLLQLLESRLDSVVLRAGLAPTIWAARQLVAHGHVEVNGRRCAVPSRMITPRDEVRLREKSRQLACVIDSLERTRPVPYVELDKDARKVRLRELPTREQIPVLCEVQLVVEFYSR